MSAKRGRPSSYVHALFEELGEEECSRLERGPSARCRFCNKAIYDKTANKKHHLASCTEFEKVASQQNADGVDVDDEFATTVAIYIQSLETDPNANTSGNGTGNAGGDVENEMGEDDILPIAKRLMRGGVPGVQRGNTSGVACRCAHDTNIKDVRSTLNEEVQPGHQLQQQQHPLAVREHGFEVFVSKETFKFNAAHFIAFKGFRERLHGHNYRVSVRLRGPSRGQDGYLMDFGEIKRTVTRVCKELNEHFICPTKSDALVILDDGQNVEIKCEDGSRFMFPKADCKMLPLVHSSAEELAEYLWGVIVSEMTVERFMERNITLMEVTVAEAANQQAGFTQAIPHPACAGSLASTANGSSSIPANNPSSSPKRVPLACFRQVQDM